MNSFYRLVFVAFLILFSSAGGQIGPARIVWKEDFENGLGKEWKDVNFSGKTIYGITLEGTNHVLKASADRSASGLAHEVTGAGAGRLRLTWRWKIDKVPPGASETDIAKFDHVARVFVAFKTALGPPRSLNYAWSSEGKLGETFNHPHSSRSRWIVLESGNAKAGEWVTETRDLMADWEKLFGDKAPPIISAVGLMTDSDGSTMQLLAYYDDFVLESTPGH